MHRLRTTAFRRPKFQHRDKGPGHVWRQKLTHVLPPKQFGWLPLTRGRSAVQPNCFFMRIDRWGLSFPARILIRNHECRRASRHLRAPARKYPTSWLSFGSSSALHPPTRVSICVAECEPCRRTRIRRTLVKLCLTVLLSSKENAFYSKHILRVSHSILSASLVNNKRLDEFDGHLNHDLFLSGLRPPWK